MILIQMEKLLKLTNSVDDHEFCWSDKRFLGVETELLYKYRAINAEDFFLPPKKSKSTIAASFN